MGPPLPVRACVIGLGEFGLPHARAYRENPRVELVALCDIRKRALREAGRELSVGRLYEDYSEMLEAEKNNIDIVSVATPDESHAEIASAALGGRDALKVALALEESARSHKPVRLDW
ncbi:MAG: hypothetical protein E6K99_03345 [Thaumarchaeota archaeon]|nr:MAG: hypothetical protein E6K99_03345 [Nitrososphaerota archaeon]